LLHALSVKREGPVYRLSLLSRSSPPGGRSYVKNTSENQRCSGDLPIKMKRERQQQH
jgi:hypothetical protein